MRWAARALAAKILAGCVLAAAGGHLLEQAAQAADPLPVPSPGAPNRRTEARPAILAPFRRPVRPSPAIAECRNGTIWRGYDRRVACRANGGVVRWH